jgi:hypothetical protein
MKHLLSIPAVALLLIIAAAAYAQESSHRSAYEMLADRNEVYFSFEFSDPAVIEDLTRVISIDNIKGSMVYAYANRKSFEAFLAYGLEYTLLTPPGLQVDSVLLHRDKIEYGDHNRVIWNFYPTYQEYLDFMVGFTTSFPEICKLDTVGISMQGRMILALKISDNVNADDAEPQFLYTSSIHGDETAGYVLMLHLIDHLLSNYGTDPRITDMVNNTQIYINPLANPDGTYHGGNNSVYGAIRGNANGIDLNRNFPDPEDGPHPDGNAWQLETELWMAYADTNHFSMAANFHGGAEVFNYPWDTWSKLAADDDWWQFVGREWADTVHLYGPSNYFTDLMNGITNGYAWYTISGGRQDYMNYFHNCREVTLEISDIKLLPVSQHLNWWNYNYRSFLNYIEQVNFGFNGIVTDTVTGQPLEAKVLCMGFDKDNSYVYSHLPSGFYARPADEGTYNVNFSAPGYFSKTFSVDVEKWATTRLDVQLRPLTFGKGEDLSGTTLTVFPNPAMNVLNVVLPSPDLSGSKIELINTQGVTVLAEKGPWTGRNLISIDIREITPGIYMLKYDSGSHVYFHKVMINR